MYVNQEKKAESPMNNLKDFTYFNKITAFSYTRKDINNLYIIYVYQLRYMKYASTKLRKFRYKNGCTRRIFAT